MGCTGMGELTGREKTRGKVMGNRMGRIDEEERDGDS